MAGRALVALNLAKAWALVASLCAFLGGLGWLLGGYRLLSIFVFCSLLAAAAVYRYGDRVVLGALGARELPQAEAPRVRSTLERLAARAGIPTPRLYLIRDGYPRALSAGPGRRGSAVAVSSGLLAALPPAELDGVLAHEVAHIAFRDVVVQTAAVVTATTLLEASRIGGWFARALLFVLGPVAAAFVHLLLSPRREFAADRMAAALCESPHGHADALVRLELAGDLVEFRANPATEPLYTVNPFAEEGVAALFNTHPAVGERVRRLRALADERAEGAHAA